ncbi:hypothetical protein [Kordiimonas sp.]|uniref:hypothetical protein n=1 Tax=Kordiimonas sp. TaxID=1970157 RepID=UPI003A95CE70
MDGITNSEPVACTLTPAAQRAETNQFRREIAPHILKRELLSNGARLTLANSPELRKSIDRLVELDKGCCSFLKHRVETVGDSITLEVTGEGSGIPLAQGFLQALAAPRPRFGNGLKMSAFLGACGLACSAPLILGALGLGFVGAGTMFVEFAALGLLLVGGAAFWFYAKRRPAVAEGTANENRCGC